VRFVELGWQTIGNKDIALAHAERSPIHALKGGAMYIFIMIILDLLEDDIEFKRTVYSDPMLMSAFIDGEKDAAMVALFDLYVMYPSITSKSRVFGSERFMNLVELELGPNKMAEWALCNKGTFREMAFNAGLNWLVSNNA
jgi:hypothetical protein